MDGMSVGTEVGVAVGAGMLDGDGSDVDGDKGFRCHGPCGMGVGVVVGVGDSSFSSSSINTGNGAAISVKLLILGDGACTYLSPFLIARRWPLTVASARGGYLRSCAEEIEGKVVRYPASMASPNVCSVGENIDAW